MAAYECLVCPTCECHDLLVCEANRAGSMRIPEPLQGCVGYGVKPLRLMFVSGPKRHLNHVADLDRREAVPNREHDSLPLHPREEIPRGPLAQMPSAGLRVSPRTGHRERHV